MEFYPHGTICFHGVVLWHRDIFTAIIDVVYQALSLCMAVYSYHE